MSSIDNRIVQMQFENSQFEKGVKQSLKTIAELKEKLEFEDAEKSFKALQRAGDSFSLVKMGDAIDSISDKFSVLGVIGRRVLENIADTAYDKLASTVKSLSIDQISAGWNKYADKTKAVQQIMAATHLDIETVNHELERLNWFSDETSYSFTDMVSNIGKFTSMNVPLDKSVTAMQGISTWAALSGAGVSEASRAMYNLSQAMGLGALRMQDWKSIALANMATSEFKQTAIDTAVALGRLKKGQVTLENFESTLSKGWFDKAVMMSVFEQYGDFATQVYELSTKENISAAEAMDRLSNGTKTLGERAFRAAQEAITFTQAIEATKDAVSSGWMNIFEQIFGNYEQAKVLWTDLANYMWDIFASPLSEISDIFKLWNKGVDEEGHKILGSRADMLEGIYDIFEAIKGVIYAIRDAFQTIFPPISLENLQAASTAIKDFGQHVKDTFKWAEDTVHTFEEMTDAEYELAKAEKEAEKIEKIKELFAGKLKIGDTSDKVKELQKALIELGYDGVGAVDGIFGNKTQQAVKDFQSQAGLSISGVMDEKTYVAIMQRVGNLQHVFSRPLKAGDRGEEVKELQNRLIELGLLDDKADGIFGPKTKKALESFQKAQVNLSETGEMNEETYKALFPEEVIDRTKETTTETLWFGNALSRIRSIVRGVSAAFDIFLQVVGFVGKIIGHVIKLSMPLVDALLSVGAAVGEAIASFDEWLKAPGNLDGAFEAIKGFLEPIGEWAKTAGDNIKKFFGLMEAPAEMMTFSKLWENIKESIIKTGAFKRVSKAIDDFKKTLAKIKPELKKSWKAFKESLGEKFNNFLSGIPDKIAAVTDAIGTFITDGIKLVTSWLPTIPGAIDKIKAFFNALTDPGDAATGKAPGFLYKVKQGFEDVIDFLFGKGDIENGKAPGILTKLWKIIVGDYAGAGLTEEQQAELIGKIEEVKTFLRRIGEAISFILTGELPKENALSENVQKSIMEFRLNIIRLFEIIGLLVSGTPLGGEDTSLDSQTTSNILQFRDTVIGIFNTIGDFVSSIFDTINAFFSGGIDFSSIEGIRKTFEGVWNNIIGFFGSVGEGAGNAAKTAGSIAIGVIALPFIGISTVISTISSYVQAILSADYSGFTDEVAKNLEGVRNWFDHTFKVIRALFTGNYRGLDGKTTSKILEFRATIKPIFDAIGNFFNSTWLFIQDIWTGITTGNWETENGQKIKGAFETVKSFFDKVGEGISILFTGEGNGDLLDPNTVSTLKQFNGYLTTIKAGVVNFFNGALGFAQDIWTGITTGDWTGFKDRIANAFENLKNFFGNVGKILRAFFTGKYDGLDNDTALAVVRAKFWIKDKLKVVGDFLANIPSLVKEWVDETLKNAGPVGEQVANVFDGISSFFTGVWGMISDIWTGITTGDWTGFKDRISNAFENVKKFFVNIGKIIAAFFTDDIDSLGLDADIKEWVIGAKAKIIEILSGITEFFTNLPETFRGLGEDLQKNFGPLGNFFSTIFNAIGSVINFIINHPILSLFIYGLFSLIKFIGSATGLLFKVSDALSNLRGSNQTFSQMIRSVAISFAIVAASIYVLGSVMDEKQLKQGMDAFLGIIKAIGIFVLAAAFLSTTKLIPGPLKGITEKLSSVTKMIKDIGIGVALLTLSVFLLSKMVSTPEGFGNFLKGLGALFGILLELFIFFIGLAVINKYIGKIETVLDGLWQVAVLIGAMTLALAALTAMNSLAKPETVWVSIAQLTTMFAMIAGLYLAIGYANKLGGIAIVGDNKSLLKGLGALAALIGVMGLIVGAFVAMNSLGLNVWQAIGQLAAIFALVGGLFLVIGKFGNNININWGTLIAAFVGLGAMIWVLGDALSKMKGIEWSVILAFTGGSAILLAALAFVLPALAALDISSALKGCLALVAFAAAFGLAIALVGGLGEQGLDAFGRATTSIGGALQNLTSLLSGVDWDAPSKMKQYVADMLSIFGTMATGNYNGSDDFKNALKDIGVGMRLFQFLGGNSSTQNADGQTIKQFATDVSEALSKLSGITNAGQIKTMLTEVGGALGVFYGNLSDIEIEDGKTVSPEQLQAAFDALAAVNIDESAIATVASYAEKGEGSTLSNFAIGIQNLSEAIGNYGDKIGGLNLGSVLLANLVLSTISGISVNLSGENTGFNSLISWVTGSSSTLSQFSEDVTLLGGAIESYATSISAVKDAPIDEATKVLQDICGLDIPSEGGLFDFLIATKDKGLGNLINNLPGLGTGLANFANNLKDGNFDADKASAALTPLRELTAIQNEMGNIGGVVSFFEGDQSIGALGKGLADFGENLAAFSGWVADLEFGDGSKLSEAIGVVGTIGEIQAKLSGMNAEQFGGFERVGDALERFFGSLARIGSGTLTYAEGYNFDDAMEAAHYLEVDFDPNPIIEKITNFETQITDAASSAQTNIQGAVKGIIEGLTNVGDIDTSGVDKAASDMISAFKSHGNEFSGTGGYFTLGLAGGAGKYINTAANAAAAVAKAMLERARAVFRVASPSKETADIGMYFDLGLSKGVDDYAKEAAASSEGVASAMLNTTSGVLSNLSAILAGDIDDTPTISPVVDLTNAKAAAASIGGMFGAQSVPVYTRDLSNRTAAETSRVSSSRSEAGSVVSRDSDNGALSMAIDNLNARMASFESAISSMKVVTDTGALIGEIAAGMDDKFGDMTMLRERGG